MLAKSRMLRRRARTVHWVETLRATRIDAGASDTTKEYRRFLGKKLEVTVEVKDSTGASARDTKVVQIADKLLCPDGTDSCNAVP